jgi:hypothetical protein
MIWPERSEEPQETPMRRQFLLVSLLALATAGSAFAAPALDAAGKCRDKGKFVDAKLCATPARASAPNKCRNIKTKKFAKCGTPGTEPVPTK